MVHTIAWVWKLEDNLQEFGFQGSSLVCQTWCQVPFPLSGLIGPGLLYLGAWVSHCKVGSLTQAHPSHFLHTCLLFCLVTWVEALTTDKCLVLDFQHLDLESKQTSVLHRLPNPGNSVWATETRLSWCNSRLCGESWNYPAFLVDKWRHAGLCSSARSIGWVAGYLLPIPQGRSSDRTGRNTKNFIRPVECLGLTDEIQ